MDENQIKAKLDVVTKAIEELGVALTDKGLFSPLAEANGPLQQEAAEQKEKAETLRQSHQKLEPVVAAKSRILSGEIDRALVEGWHEDMEVKTRESADLKANLAGILTQADEAEARVRQLQQEQTQNYRSIFEQTYPQIREATAAVVIAVIALLEKTWGDLQRYGQQSGLTAGVRVQPLLHNQHWADLTPRETGPEAPWFAKMRDWCAFPPRS
jgi:hypothetical protein